MSDFVVVMEPGQSIASSVVRLLRESLNVPTRPMHVEKLRAGGTLVYLESPAPGYSLWKGKDRLIAAVGRPRLTHVASPTSDFNFGKSFDAWLSDERSASLAIIGMGACLVVEHSRFRIFTDRLGSRPVYVGRDVSGRILSIGTSLEAVALVAGRRGDVDRVSVAELLIYNSITFPYTSRHGITELPPASCTVFCPTTERIATTTYWEPSEPSEWPVARDVEEELEQAIRVAGVDATSGCDRVLVALSGGRDSRAVMGSVPSERLAGGLTFVTRMNREAEVAKRVAEAFGVRHLVCRRPESFYEHMLERGVQLLGTELRATVHQFCVVDNGLDKQFDLLLGGYLADTLLKHHYMPREARERWRPKSIRERVLPRHRARKVAPGISQATIDRVVVEDRLVPEFREAVRERRRARTCDLERIRPLTASEWVRFWPISRQDDAADALGASRLMASESLFNHPLIAEAACRIHPRFRWEGVLANRVLGRFFGPAGGISNANTGTSVLASPRTEVRASRRLRKQRRRITREIDDPYPWNETGGSWPDTVLLQKRSSVWQERRSRLRHSSALDIIDGILDIDARRLVEAYQPSLPATTCEMAVQLVWHFDRL